MKPGQYPFLFYVPAIHPTTDERIDVADKFLVKIAAFDYTFAHTAWMCDKSLPAGRTLQPDVDLIQEEYEFDSEEKALNFI